MRPFLSMLAALGLLAAAPAARGQGWQIIPCPSCPGGYAAIPPWYGGGSPSGFQTQPYYGGQQFASPFPGGGGGYPTPMVGEQASFGPPPVSPFNSPPPAAVLPAYGGGNGCNGGQWAAQPMYFTPQPQFFVMPERRRLPSHDIDLNLRSRLR